MDDFYIRKICAGDENAFRYFIKEYKDMAFSIAVSVVKDEFIAQEVVQDAFVKSYHHIKSFNKQSSISTWFYRIVTNEALMRLRKMKKDIIEFSENYPGDSIDENPMNALQEDVQQYLVNQALQELAPKESLALRLFYLQEESMKEVCEITGWSTSNTKVILHRARKNMFAVLTRLMKINTHD